MAHLVETSRSIGLSEISLIDRVEAAIEELYDIRDTFFPKDPKEKTLSLQNHVDAALALADTAIPQERRKSTSQRAIYEFFRGKILDVFPDYQKEAEDHLSKAVKLNPSLADAWLCLGNCIWKKGDLPSSKNCFSLALSKGPNKKILCQLSMLERSMAQVENQAHLVDESIQHAKEAVMLDVKDGNSWYNLGNACLTSFFVTGAWDHTKLQQSLKAYQNAGQARSKRLAPLLASLVEVNLNSTHKKVNLSLLAEGLNKAVMVIGKILLFVKHDDIAPSYYIVCDAAQSCFILSVYGLHHDAIKEGDRVTLVEPFYRINELRFREKHYQLKSIRVDFAEQILVNEKAPAPHHAVRASIHAQHKP